MKAEGSTTGRTIAERLAARAQEKARGRALALLARLDMTGTERLALSMEKRLSGIVAALFGRWTVLGSLGAEEVAPGVLYLEIASREDAEGGLRELGIELDGEGGELLWSVLKAPAALADGGPGGDPEAGEAVATITDWPDARQALIDWWGDA